MRKMRLRKMSPAIRGSSATNDAQDKGDTPSSPTATHYNTMQHTATQCSTLQHTATHRNTLKVHVHIKTRA